jgi:hypothetical protein
MGTPLINRATKSRNKVNDRQAETRDLDFQTSVEILVAVTLLAFYCMLRFPEFGAVIAQYNQF